MKFDFSYQKVLDFKEKEKDMAKQEFGSIKHKQMELQEKLDGLDLVEEQIFNQYNDVDHKTVWEILEFQQEIDHVNRQKKQLEIQTQQLHHEAEHKHKVLIEKTQEAKIWNQWKSKSMAAFQKQMDLQEQAMLDEMAVLRHSRRI
jgi:flagellar protein FliJ